RTRPSTHHPTTRRHRVRRRSRPDPINQTPPLRTPRPHPTNTTTTHRTPTLLGRVTMGPGLRFLQLAGDSDQHVFAPVGGDDLDADREAVVVPGQRHVDRR